MMSHRQREKSNLLMSGGDGGTPYQALSNSAVSINNTGSAAAAADSKSDSKSSAAANKPIAPEIERDAKPTLRVGDLKAASDSGIASLSNVVIEKNPFSIEDVGFLVNDEPTASCKLTRHVFNYSGSKNAALCTSANMAWHSLPLPIAFPVCV